MTESSLLNDDVCIGSGDSLPSPRLPPELTDRVIDNLHDSKADLRRCSLVCRSWLPSSSFHLFHYLHIRPHPDSDFEDQRIFNAFITLVQTSPRVYSYLRGLSFESKAPGTGLSTRCSRMHLRILEEILEEILDYLPNLLHLDLSLSIVNPTNGLPNLIARPGGHLRKLKTLTFTWIYFTASVMDVIGCFNEVDSLVLRGVNYAYIDNITPVTHHTPGGLRVRSLSFEGAMLDCFQTLKHRLDCSSGSLTTFAVDYASVTVSSDLEAALQDVGSSLLHLRFCYNLHYQTTFLFPCTRLQSLNLTLRWGLGCLPGYDGPMQWEGGMAMIRDGNLSSLTHLGLILHCHIYAPVGHDPEKCSFTHHLESVRWEMLHEATSRCTLLRSIEVGFMQGLKGHMAGKRDLYIPFVEKLLGIMWRRIPERTRSLLDVGFP